jgi:hypothetical protein
VQRSKKRGVKILLNSVSDIGREGASTEETTTPEALVIHKSLWDNKSAFMTTIPTTPIDSIVSNNIPENLSIIFINYFITTA